MTKKVLIIGGNGKIGRCVGKDIKNHTDASVTITGRKSPYNQDFPFLPLDLNNSDQLPEIISDYNLVVHCAGPFHHRNGRVLKSCIENGVNYIDVSDHRSFHQQVASYHQAALQKGVTAILHTGVFPGISNLMAREGVEVFDNPKSIHLYYAVAGSGGAGLTVMRTTFLGLQSPFSVWKQGQWEEKRPYSEREMVTFPHYGEAAVYWFDVAETYTLPQTFPVETVVTKFGSLPDFYNDLTAMSADRFPRSLLQNPVFLELLSRLSLAMARVTDHWSGIGIAMRVEVQGYRGNKKQTYCLQCFHDHTAIAAGMGAGTVAQLLLNQEIIQPGVWSVEQAVSIPLFQKMMEQRKVNIEREWVES